MSQKQISQKLIEHREFIRKMLKTPEKQQHSCVFRATLRERYANRQGMKAPRRIYPALMVK